MSHVGPRSLTRPSELGARGLSHWTSGEFPWIEGLCHTLLGRERTFLLIIPKHGESAIGS